MKKGGIVLIVLTLVFCAFTIGLLVGRHHFNGDITIVAPTGAGSETSPSQPEFSGSPTTIQGLKVNINTADATLLDALPGVGPVLAQRIVDYRAEHGPFTELETLLLIEGIGEKKFEQILNLITLED